MKELTKKQREVLNFIIGSYKQHGAAPSYREIAKYFNFKSLKTVYDHINTLKTKGYLIQNYNQARNLVPQNIMEFSEKMNVYSDIGHTYPILSEKQIIDHLFISSEWLKGKDILTLRVKDESMIDAHIQIGDYVFLDRTATIYEGDIIGIIINNEATLKYYNLKEGIIVLKPANATMSNIIIPRESRKIKIIGKAVGLIRKLI